jgi:WS/DGAT/MGAT family acyltransferase
MAGTSTPLTSTEAVLWMIERDPALRSTIMAIALLDGHVDVDRLRERVRQAAQAFPRLRQRVAQTRRGGLCWTDVPDWDVDHHLTRLRLPVPGTTRQLLDLAGEQAGEAFDPARPLWHLTLIEGIEGDRSALVVKVHHSMTDGVGGIGLMWLFTDSQPHPDSPVDLGANRRPAPKRGRPYSLASAPETLKSAITDPLGSMRSVSKTAGSALKILAPARRSLSPLTTGRGLDRHLEVIEVPLRDLEKAGHAVGGTVNDAFMAAIVGGLRRYHVAHGEYPTELRVTMPISVRRAGDDAGGNRFTPARFTVPLEISDAAQRMRALGAVARQWRHEPAVGMTDLLATALSHLPGSVTTNVFGSMLKGVDFVATNVPGSPERGWLAGAEVRSLYGFGPPSGAAMSVALVSHVDTCCIGINVDTAAIDDFDVLRASLAEGFDEVVAVGRSRRHARRVHDTPQPARAGRVGRTPRRLSALDASFLEAETPNTPMHVGALMILEGKPLRDERGELRMADIRSEIAAQLPYSPRMRQVPVGVPFARPVWQDASTFDITEHVRHVRVPPPGTRAQLEVMCCELQMHVLDRTRPLWEMWFVDGLEDGSVGLVYKVHHAVVDGISAAETFELLLAGDAPIVAGAAPASTTNSPHSLADALIDNAVASARLLVSTSGQLVTNPRRAVATAVGLGRLLRPSVIAPHTTLNRTVGVRRRLVPVSFDLAEVKAIGRRHDATVNDVVLALVAAGIGELLSGRGDGADHVQVLVPVSLRSDTEHYGAGNRVAALMVPVDIRRDPVAALCAIRSATRAHKAGPEAAVLDLLLQSSELWPSGLLGPVSRQIVHRQPFVNLVVTNVRGAELPLSLLGARITDIVPVVPLGGNLSLGVAVLSYAGRIVVGLHADPDACGDLDVLAGGIERAFVELKSTATSHDSAEIVSG